MASRPITYQADFETPAPQGSTASTARELAAFVRAPRAYGIWHDLRVLENRSGGHADAAVQPWSFSTWFAGIPVRVVRAIAEEHRIRRDTRELMAMSDHMLKDLGLTRGQIGGEIRYGRN